MSAPKGLLRAAAAARARACNRATTKIESGQRTAGSGGGGGGSGCIISLHEFQASQLLDLASGTRRRRATCTTIAPTTSRGLASLSTSSTKTLSSSSPASDKEQSYDEDDDAADPRVVAVDVGLSRAVVKARGDLPYGSREYRLLVPPSSSSSLRRRNQKLMTSNDDSLVVVARLRAHRNIIFGATTSFFAGAFEAHQQLPPISRFIDACSPLVEMALRDAGSQGEQPQAMATLHGLSAWVRSCLTSEADDVDGNNFVQLSPNCDSQVLIQLTSRRQNTMTEGDRVALEAVRAIAAGVPRHQDEAHAVGGSSTTAAALLVDGGTMRDGRELWIRLAREYAPRSNEVRLYRTHAAEVTTIELVGSNNSADDEYMKSAGGAMVRMFFL